MSLYQVLQGQSPACGKSQASGENRICRCFSRPISPEAPLAFLLHFLPKYLPAPSPGQDLGHLVGYSWRRKTIKQLLKCLQSVVGRLGN